MPEHVAILLEKTAAYIEEIEAKNAQLEVELQKLDKTASTTVNNLNNDEVHENMTLDKIAAFGGESPSNSDSIGWDEIIGGNSLGEPSHEKVVGPNAKDKLENFLESVV